MRHRNSSGVFPGVQTPGDAFWTKTTLARAQARYPNWDLTPYREALAG